MIIRPESNIKPLLFLTAIIETAAGLALAVAPAFSVNILLGTPLSNPAALVVARVAGMALISLGIACGRKPSSMCEQE